MGTGSGPSPVPVPVRIVLFTVLCLLVAAVPPASAQHLGSRLQWQPETMAADPRLDQPVEIEIIGRAAVPALELLSQVTGVSLTVAPEDLNTVGERKLTIISKGLTLKAIMAQLPEALQEAHWDIDTSGDESAYLLHRNGSADETMKWLEERDAARQVEKRRAELVNRMEEAKRTLAMSPEELAELEKTDPLLARSVRDPHSRDLLEIVLSLPPELAERFRQRGSIAVSYAEAPERWRKAVDRIADWYGPRWFGEEQPDEVRNWRDHLDHAVIGFNDNRVEHGWGVWISLDLPHGGGWGPVIHDVALQPRYCNLDEGEPCYTRLLVATGTPDEGAAFRLASDLDHSGFRADDAKREERHQREWIELSDPDLLQTVVIGDAEFADFGKLQALIANKAGIPIVSDFFTLRAPYLSDEVRQGVPLWRLLYLIGEDGFRNEDVYLWQKRGDCLVFHRADWYSRAHAEVPESVIVDYRARLAQQGELTLDDLAELAVLLQSRSLPASNFPRDLQLAGIRVGISYDFPALSLYASLSPEQREAIRTPDGLAFSDMTIAQRRIVLDRAANRPLPIGADEAAKAAFLLVRSAEEAYGRTFDKTELQLRFPSVTDTALVAVKVTQPAAGPSP
ncbi:MAG: hypothetical protein ACE149_01435 [Armatimonadota bacterium]